MFKKIFEVKWINAFLAIGIVISTALSVAASLLLGGFIDFMTHRTSFDTQIIRYLILLLTVMIASAGSNIFLGKFLPLRRQLRKTIDFSQEVIDGVMEVPLKNYLKHEKGYYINVVTSSAFIAGDIYGQLNIELVGNLLCVGLMIVLAGFINPWFAVVYLLYIPIYALLSQKPNKKIADYQRIGLPVQDAFLSQIKKIVESKREININHANSYFYNLYQDRSESYLKFITKFKLYSILSNNVPSLLSCLLTASILVISAKLYFSGMMTLGLIFSMFQLSQLLQGPLNRCFEIRIYSSINKVHLERLVEFEKEKDGKSGFEEKYQEMEDLASLENGTIFSNANKDKKLYSFNKLTFPKKKLILIKGGNGTGKSTLTNLLTGFCDSEIFDGSFHLDNSLKEVAYLSHPLLFTEGDVQENLLGQEIDHSVADLLGINFLDKVINDAGSNLSFGEQQKLALLRVLSSNSNVYILDEPFTNLDRETIDRLTLYLAGLKKDKTVITIIHSPELDPYANLILEIKNKKIRTAGNPASAVSGNNAL